MRFPKVYKNIDIELDSILNKRIAVIGYGNQGRAQALNLRDSGLNVCIGLRNNSKSIKQAHDEGFRTGMTKDVVKDSDIISILIPDQLMGEVYNSEIKPNLAAGQTLLFSHGYNILYNIIKPNHDVNVVLVSPSGSGTELRRKYLDGVGIPGLFAIDKDISGDSEELVLAYCKAIGLTFSGVVRSTFKEETETDLFGEQAVLTGSIPKIIQSSYKVLLEGGYSPAVSWLVCYYELKTIVDMFHAKGFEFMNNAISDTAEFGGITRGNRIINQDVKNELAKILQEIQSGEFYLEWQKEHKEGYPNFNQMRETEKEMSIDKIGQYMLSELFDGK